MLARPLALALLLVTGCSREEYRGSDSSDESEAVGYVTWTDTLSQVTRGVRLELYYDSTAGAFVGKLANVSGRVAPKVRVEVHLLGGGELGPTRAQDLGPADVRSVYLADKGHNVDHWTAHVEVGSDEHGERSHH